MKFALLMLITLLSLHAHGKTRVRELCETFLRGKIIDTEKRITGGDSSILRQEQAEREIQVIYLKFRGNPDPAELIKVHTTFGGQMYWLAKKLNGEYGTDDDLNKYMELQNSLQLTSKLLREMSQTPGLSEERRELIEIGISSYRNFETMNPFEEALFDPTA